MMQRGDMLIRNGTILTMDSRFSIIEKGLVAIQGDAIAYVGIDEGSAWEGEKVIDAR